MAEKVKEIKKTPGEIAEEKRLERNRKASQAFCVCILTELTNGVSEERSNRN